MYRFHLCISLEVAFEWFSYYSVLEHQKWHRFCENLVVFNNKRLTRLEIYFWPLQNDHFKTVFKIRIVTVLNAEFAFVLRLEVG